MAEEKREEGSNLPIHREERGMSPFEEWGMDTPLTALRRFHDELDRMFEGLMPGLQLPMFRRRELAPFEMMRKVMPPLDIWETDNEVKLCLDVPGVEPKDIEIYTTENNIRIRAEMKHEEEEKTRGFYRMERRFGSFDRSVDLPSSVTPDQAKATFKHGVLEVTLPKTEEARRHMKKVEVQSEEEQMIGSKGGERSQEQQQSQQKKRK